MHRSSPYLVAGLIALLLLVGGCGGGGSGGSDGNGNGGGGGGGGGGTTSPPPPPSGGSGGNTPTYDSRLTPATTLTEFLTQIKTRYPNALLNAYTSGDPTLWGSVKDFPKTYALTNTNNNPISGRYTTWSARFPNPNGKIEFGTTGADRSRMTIQTLDLNNNASGLGTSQAFYGVAEADSFPISTYGPAQVAASNSSIPTTIVAEELIKDGAGVLQYRSLRFMLGYLTNYTAAASREVDGSGGIVVGPPFNGVVGDYFVGRHVQQVVECFVANCQVGFFVEYNIFMAKQ